MWSTDREIGGWWVGGWVDCSRNWRRHPAVTFYSLTLADYRQLMHNKYTPLRVHYRLINISLRERPGWGRWWWWGRGGGSLTDIIFETRKDYKLKNKNFLKALQLHPLSSTQTNPSRTIFVKKKKKSERISGIH